MSGMYWGLTALYLLDRLQDLDPQPILDWVMSCRHDNGGFGGSPRNDPHMLYTLSAVQILALYDRLDLVDADTVAKCGCWGMCEDMWAACGQATAREGACVSDQRDGIGIDMCMCVLLLRVCRCGGSAASGRLLLWRHVGRGRHTVSSSSSSRVTAAACHTLQSCCSACVHLLLWCWCGARAIPR